MNTVVFKLLPYSKSGIVSRHRADTLTLSGFRNDINLESLQAELEASWLDLAKQEAANRVKVAVHNTSERLRPINFIDLGIKLQLGRITLEEQQILNVYYNKLDEIEQEAIEVYSAIEEAKSVEALNNISWPEWVEWKPLPIKFKLEIEQTKSEAFDKIEKEVSEK